MPRARATIAICAAAILLACAGAASVGRAPIAGTVVAGAEPSVSYAPAAAVVPLELDAATGVARGRLVLLGRPYAIRVDAADPLRPPRIEADRRGEGVAFDGAVTGSWTTEAPGDPPNAWISGRVTFVLPVPGGGLRDYAVDLDYSGGRGEGRLEAAATTWIVGEADLGGRQFRYALRDRNLDGSMADLDGLQFLIDRDGDGQFDGSENEEEYAAGRPFNVGTCTFFLREVSDDGCRAEFARAVWPVGARPFLGKGDVAPAIEGTDLDGKTVSLASLRGRKALLVFWASW